MSEQDQADLTDAEAGLAQVRAALARMAERQAPVVEPIHLDVLRGARDAAETMVLAAMHDHVAVAVMVHRQDLADGYV